MARPELGTKRVCPTTGRKFYDLNRSPIISPYTGQVVTIAAPLLRGVRPEAVAVRPVVKSDEEAELDTAADVELISLEDVEEEGDTAKVTTTEDDIEIEDDHPADDDTFLEADEDESDDVIDLIGDGIEEEEER
ncbi:TIGR02300 family protein [Labrys wisconsinensis]|uniref:Uncharacterized protein (TIGR02300 family) n=1 Tax=Labrys wisconsinensis TaxID=425677 RepID=A0ABU0JHH7_9HYPH|nr:TIGR02300 family protein [Labrys wisconsinensis]MDQ0473742.1 uncharacterized protein (TIGR02300 family) [Labrys wisconsinensis]